MPGVLVGAAGVALVTCDKGKEAPKEREYSLVSNAHAGPGIPPVFSKESRECVACHQKETNATVQQWGASRHYRAKVGCFECHQAHPGDKDAFMHHNQRIATIVSPKDCGRCHEKETKEFEGSHHAQAGKILGSLDNVLAEVVEGSRVLKTEGFPDGVSAAAVNGCWQCHGSEVKVLKEGKLDPATWPNTGIGRLNPDDSRGSCSACHSRHKFSVSQARNPENCGKCHMGPDHPQIEIYNESKHGIAFRANVSKMNLENDKWVVGQGLQRCPDVRDLSHVGYRHPTGDPRRGFANLLEQPPGEVHSARNFGRENGTTRRKDQLEDAPKEHGRRLLGLPFPVVRRFVLPAVRRTD